MHDSPFSFFTISSLVGGLALFLYGMQLGEKNIRKIGGTDLRRIISVITRHRPVAYITGVIATLITQSSSATTVILVGLVNAKIMTLGQSLGMILGADLGTTVTVQLFVFKFYQVAPLLIALGFALSLNNKNEQIAMYGKLAFSLGLIFFGMYQMSIAVSPMRTHPLFEQVLNASFSNTFYGVLAGTIITAIIQSSAATLTIAIALLQVTPEESRNLSSLMPIVMGANLGTCATAFLSTFNTNTSAKQVAWSHFMFKLFGVLFFIPFISILNQLDPLFPDNPALRIAMLHTLFNLMIGIIFLPILSPFEKLVKNLVRTRNNSMESFQCSFINDSFVNLPAIALEQSAKEINRMGKIILKMAEASYRLIDEYSLKNSKHILHLDDEVDFLHEHIVVYITKMSRGELENISADQAYQLIMLTTDLEHIGDSISKNVIVLADKIRQSPVPLSAEGKVELLTYYQKVITDLNDAMESMFSGDQLRADEVYRRKQERDTLYTQLFGQHLDRLFNRKPESLQTTSIHIDLLEEFRKIDHFVFRIAGHVARKFRT